MYILFLFYKAFASAEQCSNVGSCKETLCKNEDGWWLHCYRGYCVCNHDTYTGTLHFVPNLT